MEVFKNTYTFWAMLIASNILMYLLTIVISFLWSKINNYKTLKLTKQDAFNSVIVLVINIIIAFPGYLLFQNGQISFIENSNFIRDFLLLYMGFDFAMYVLHLASHSVWPFKKFHIKHHTHQYFNAISLYVLDPIETVFFGLLLMLSAWIFTLNIYSFLVFIFFNWISGVIGHLNTNSQKQPSFFGNHIFHKTHHQYPNSNYGFYTVIWDKAFGTIYEEKK